ncbi:FAD:protein FMN transferase [Chlamydiales bacterium SCGC AB-751-O23]|nr:FAD:protein FMN transferase [Chlamydiales bacterium SCGC AB-751-O23]
MTIPFEVKVGAENSEEQTKVFEIVNSTFDEVDIIYNNWNPKSEISFLNQLPAHKKHKLSKDLEMFLKECEAYVRLTDGKFDPTIGPFHKLWTSRLENGGIPSKEEITRVFQKVGWQHIHIEDGYFYKDEEGVSIDLGGVAKGYAVDIIVDRLNKAGFDNIYVSWGGEIKTKGRHPSDREWTVLVRFWEPPEEAKVPMNNGALATSGDYLQFWKILEKGKEKRFSHIIDISKQSPIRITKDSISSVSILSDSCLKSDILATCGMLFSDPEEAQLWYESKKKSFLSFDFWIFSHNKGIKRKGSI